MYTCGACSLPHPTPTLYTFKDIWVCLSYLKQKDPTYATDVKRAEANLGNEKYQAKVRAARSRI